MKTIFFITGIVIVLSTGIAKAQNEDIPDISTIEYLWGSFGRIFGDDLQKEFSRISKSGNADSLNNFFKYEFDKMSKEKKNKMIKKRPGTYYLMRAIAARSANDENTEFFSYSLFLYIQDSTKVGLSRRDRRTLGRMNTNQFNLRKWTSEATVKQARIYQRAKTIDSILIDINDSLKNLDKRIYEYEKQIIHLDSILKNDESELNYYMDTRDDPSTFRDALNADITTLTLDDGVASDKFVVSPDLTSYPVGCYLDDNIREYIDIVRSAVNQALASHPDIRREDIRVTLKITGKADGRGRGSKITTYNASSEQFGRFTRSYKLKQGWEGANFIENEKAVFNPAGSLTYSYYNYELAFLRAYASFKLIYDNLTSQNINVADGNLFAIEYSAREDTCRGVIIEMTISGLFKHYERKIGYLDDRIDKCTKKKNVLLIRRDKLLEEKKRMQELFDRTEEGKRNFDKLHN